MDGAVSCWGLQWAWMRKDAWLARWLVVEGIFLAYFTAWYISRYYKLWAPIPFWSMVLQIVVLSGLVLGSGYIARAGKKMLARNRHDDAPGK
jgi:hypothetical protein